MPTLHERPEPLPFWHVHDHFRRGFRLYAGADLAKVTAAHEDVVLTAPVELSASCEPESKRVAIGRANESLQLGVSVSFKSGGPIMTVVGILAATPT